MPLSPGSSPPDELMSWSGAWSSLYPGAMALSVLHSRASAAHCSCSPLITAGVMSTGLYEASPLLSALQKCPPSAKYKHFEVPKKGKKVTWPFFAPWKCVQVFSEKTDAWLWLLPTTRPSLPELGRAEGRTGESEAMQLPGPGPSCGQGFSPMAVGSSAP